MNAKTIMTVGGRDIPVRGLLRKEVKALRKKGIDLVALTINIAEDAQDEVLGLVCNKADIKYLDELCNIESLKVFKKILGLTFGRKDEEKN